VTKRVQDEMLDHEFDGIREFDNPPPGWIMWILYASVVFAVVYWLFFHTFGIGTLPHQELVSDNAKAAEIQLARMAGQELTDETLQLMAAVPERVNEGRQIFEQFCVQCHLQKGEGSVGPNLTDGYWLHGGKPMQILNTVTRGVPEKGMVAWGDQLGPMRVQKVVAYTLTIKNTNVPGKAPQGVLEPVEDPKAPGTAAPAPAMTTDAPAAAGAQTAPPVAPATGAPGKP
jgi:cytochrome c oxidase cbb3-type subunit 3